MSKHRRAWRTKISRATVLKDIHQQIGMARGSLNRAVIRHIQPLVKIHRDAVGHVLPTARQVRKARAAGREAAKCAINMQPKIVLLLQGGDNFAAMSSKSTLLTVPAFATTTHGAPFWVANAARNKRIDVDRLTTCQQRQLRHRTAPNPCHAERLEDGAARRAAKHAQRRQAK